MEIYGEEGTISAPDPNTFGGPVRVWKDDGKEWREIPLSYGRTGQSRGIGAADMAKALMTGRPHRANAEMAYHALDIMHAVIESSESGMRLDIESSCARPEPLPRDLPDAELD